MRYFRVQWPEFKPAEIDDDYHHRISRAVHSKMTKSFEMRESDLDGVQALKMLIRDVEKVVREVMEDIRHQHCRFQEQLDDDAGPRWFRGDASVGVAFQIGQLRYAQAY